MFRFATLALTLAALGTAQADVITVNLGPYANARMQDYQPTSAGYPEGPVTLGGVSFNIQNVGGNNSWLAQNVPGPVPHVLSIPVNVPSVQRVHTLINTFYGQPGPSSYVALEVFGSGGAYFRKDLIGNVDVRDHFFSGNTNSINGTSTVNVYSSGGGQGSESRLDMQTLLLPAAFQTATLNEFRLTSTGGFAFSDATIQGLTFVKVPEPSSLALVGLGGLAAAYWRRRASGRVGS